MKKKKIQYRKINFYASERRINQGWCLHPELLHGLRKIAKDEGKSISWLIETALRCEAATKKDPETWRCFPMGYRPR